MLTATQEGSAEFLTDELRDSGYATPRQRLSKSTASSKRSHASQDSRYSLAFELANADDDPQAGFNHDLMTELGLVEEGDAYAEEGDFSFGDANDDSFSLSSDPIGLPQSLSAATPVLAQSQRKSQPQIVDIVASDDEEETMRSMEQATCDLQTELTQVDEFLGKIKSYTSDTSSSSIRPSSGIQESQNFLEATMTSFVKSLAIQINARETQLFELHDAMNTLSRIDSSVLASLEPLDSLDFQEHPAGAEGESAESLKVPLHAPTTPSPSPTSTNFPTGIQNKAKPEWKTPSQQLQQATISLLDALAHINEHSQVLRASQHDSQRKLKSIKAGLAGLEREMEGLERSRTFIEGWEDLERQQVPAQRLHHKRRYQAYVESHLNEVGDLLEQASYRASKLLAV